jgi:hypothetical protein
VIWIHLPEDRKDFRALVNRITKLRFTSKLIYSSTGDHVSWRCIMYSKYHKILEKSLSNIQRKINKSKLQQTSVTSENT